MTDREKITRAAARKGWNVSESGRTLVLRKGSRSLTATFRSGNPGVLESFQSGAYPGRGGLRGILNIMRTV